MSRPLAVAVAEVLETCARDRIPERALPMLARLVKAGAALEYRAGDAEMDEPCEEWDEALRDVAAALGVTEKTTADHIEDTYEALESYRNKEKP